ncbi:MAG: DUF1565 domain-containing protein [Planctomycetes bacterium]|nr:DUF1565 domain-containing protein [Planctomycetota bacterium]
MNSFLKYLYTLSIGLLFSYSTLVVAAAIDVPKQFSSIQAAIDGAKAGDVVKVKAGRYRENIVLKEGVILRGDGAENTIIDGSGHGTVVVGAKGSVIEGFLIAGSGKSGTTGQAMDMGIAADHAPMTIANCHISKNNGGIRLYYSPSNIINNRITENRGYGIYNLYSDMAAANNIISDNGGSGISNSYSNPEIVNNTIHNNETGIYSEVSRVVVNNNIISANRVTGIYWAEFPNGQDGAEPILSYNLVWGNKADFYHVSAGMGAVAADPLFVNGAKGDFKLKPGSPAYLKGDEKRRNPDGSRSHIGAFGGTLAQLAIPAPPQLKSYADLPTRADKIKEPDYTSQGAWSMGNSSGEGNYQSYCVMCHGAQGKGDGVLGESLDVKPRDLSNSALLSARSDDFLFKVIKNGGAAAGFTENMMPFAGQLSDTEIRNVIAYIREKICHCQYSKEAEK